MSAELDPARLSFSMLNPRIRLKGLFGDEEGDDSGSENVDRAGVVGGEKDMECLPFGLPRAMKLS